MSKTYNDTRDAVFEELYEIAYQDSNVVLLTADTGALKFSEFKRNLPQQFFNVGIAEQNMMSVAAGLALSGKHVFVYGISNFVSLRCFEQIKIDICCMGLPVTILASGTGYIYSSDGPTHHMIENISIMRALPGMTIWSPSDYAMAATTVHLAYHTKTPSFIFFDKGPFVHIYDNYDGNFKNGLTLLKTGKDITIVATGTMVTQALKLVEEFKKYGVEAGIIDLYRLKPLNEKLFVEAIKDSKQIVTIEEHTIFGGLGSIVAEVLADNKIFVPLKRFGIPDTFRREIGSREMLYKLDGLDISSISRVILGL